jgi:hypothetical protein
MMRIEILYFEGCPNVRPTLERLNRILAGTGIDATVDSTAVDHYEAAQTFRFLGSPTVRINGVDIESVSPVQNRFWNDVSQV